MRASHFFLLNLLVFLEDALQCLSKTQFTVISILAFLLLRKAHFLLQLSYFLGEPGLAPQIVLVALLQNAALVFEVIQVLLFFLLA